MTKQEIISDIRNNFGSMLNIQQATQALGYKDRKATIKFLNGVPVCNMGKEKKYMAADIGRRIYERLEATT